MNGRFKIFGELSLIGNPLLPGPTSSPGPSPHSKWRSEKTLAKAAKVAPKVR